MAQSRFLKMLSLTAAIATVSLSSHAFATEKHGGGHGTGMSGSETHKPGGGMMHQMKDKMMPGMGHRGGHANAAGEPGKASAVTRTLNIDMTDNRYSTEEIAVRAGETLRFIIRNKGELVHEFNIGTSVMHKGHQKEMMMMVDHGVLEADKINHARMKMDMGGGKTMEHNDPNSALLEPGKSKEIVWKFSKAGTFEFACNVPGHYDAGMVGEIRVN
jgi:uncharacterized cupredoxin-like copper-binding protein